jgi:hypothetical protein
MVLIEEVLWNIFTYYSLHGNPKDPSRLHSLALLKLCKDVHAMDASMVENALSQQDFQLIYTAILKDPTKKVRASFPAYFLAFFTSTAQLCHYRNTISRIK